MNEVFVFSCEGENDKRRFRKLERGRREEGESTCLCSFGDALEMFLECIDGVRRVYLWTVAGAPSQEAPPLQEVLKKEGTDDDGDEDDYGDDDDDEGEEGEEEDYGKEVHSSPRDVPPLRPTVRELRKRFIDGKSAQLAFEYKKEDCLPRDLYWRVACVNVRGV